MGRFCLTGVGRGSSPLAGHFLVAEGFHSQMEEGSPKKCLLNYENHPFGGFSSQLFTHDHEEKARRDLVPAVTLKENTIVQYRKPMTTGGDKLG